MDITFVIWCLSVIFYTVKGIESTKWKCLSEDETTIDRIAAEAIVIGTGQKFPTNNKEMKALCVSRIKILDRIDAYKNTCLTGSKKQTFAVFLFSIRHLLSGYCKNLDSKRTRALLAAAHCINESILPKLNQQCYNSAVQKLTDAQILTDSKEKLSTMCCTYVHFLTCIRGIGTFEGGEGEGGNDCSERHINTALGFVRQAFDGTINLICGEYSEGSDRCEDFRFAKVSRFNSTFRSFAAPAIRIISSI